MLPKNAVQKPFVFNLLKHHIRFARALIKNYRKEDEEEFIALMNKGGNLWCDYYFGRLTPKLIAGEVKTFLSERDLLAKQQFDAWILNARGKFRNISLSDGSEWTLLIGTEPGKYIHLHPARYSKFTIRVRLAALKTVISGVLFYGDIFTNPDYEKINFIRKTILGLSPLALAGNVAHLQKIARIFGY